MGKVPILRSDEKLVPLHRPIAYEGPHSPAYASFRPLETVVDGRVDDVDRSTKNGALDRLFHKSVGPIIGFTEIGPEA